MTHQTDIVQIKHVEELINTLIGEVQEAVSENRAIAQHGQYYESSGALDDIDTHLMNAFTQLRMASRAVTVIKRDAMRTTGVTDIKELMERFKNV